MKGNIIGFDPEANTGAIAGHDGKRYDFATLDWHGGRPPRHGDVVDFAADGSRAVQIYPVEPEYVQPGFLAFYFSPSGRVSRSQYWLKYFLPVFVIGIVIEVIILSAGKESAAGSAFDSLLNLFYLVTLWPGIAVLIKRIHDRNKTGWLVMLLYVPLVFLVAALIATVTAAVLDNDAATTASGIALAIVGLITVAITIWFFIEFGCMRGTVGPNKYGPDPVPQS
jgi:uncharacterized membrane protein YhaH (DUF805 family)